MKKILPIALFGCLATNVALAGSDNDCPKYNTITYTTQAETTVKSDSILVQVTGYATTTLEDQNSIQKEISDEVNSIVKADWKVKNLEQDKSRSGALNVTLQLEARISQQDLNNLQKALENQKASGKKLVAQVLDYNPPAKDIQAAKQDLMVQIYKDTKAYLDNFNKETHSNYLIQSIKYNDTNSYRPRNTVMFMKAANNEMDASSTNPNPVAVSQDITINANVTFMER
ncbi:hypothetical protein LO80_01110 [Candidatus Francisella endociliophora]|uniref:DUF541 domain-containing protein n=1 Tax=Candidatus Francisella endociliophora TaxID=653937 RepID=A0A097EMD4_9GAMM|nr:hypothetical protein [Francisella sp. FSC1006]AIT08708.1 hypothetical protein LO80_01110 [Francisella sp. FSC1006]